MAPAELRYSVHHGHLPLRIFSRPEDPLGEGFDGARLGTLFLAPPVSWKGTLLQYAGRLHRLHPGKHELRIVDYVDSKVPMLARVFAKRRIGYRAMGYRDDDNGAFFE